MSSASARLTCRIFCVLASKAGDLNAQLSNCPRSSWEQCRNLILNSYFSPFFSENLNVNDHQPTETKQVSKVWWDWDLSIYRCVLWFQYQCCLWVQPCYCAMICQWSDWRDLQHSLSLRTACASLSRRHFSNVHFMLLYSCICWSRNSFT